MNAPKRRIAFIVNPASGVNRSALDTIEAFIAANLDRIESSLHLTKASGDAERFAREAVTSGYNLVAAYGGDGTMMEAASGVHNSEVPLLMLPGGTANVMAIDLGIPTELETALALALQPELSIRPVDMGSVDNNLFLLRVGIGYEAEMSAHAARGEKSKLGRLAYIENAIHKLRGLRATQYIMTIDDETYVRTGITCMICNSSSIGIPNLRLAYNSDVSDGLLDIIVIRNAQPGTILKTLFNVVRSLFRGTESGSVHIDHWQGKKVTVQTKYRQFVARDGEPLKKARQVSAFVIEHALQVVIVPPAASVAEGPGNELQNLD